jgi:hypothetical protein
MEKYGFPAANMVVLTDDQQDPIFQPTKQNIINGISWLIKDAKQGDSLFFHYSGHGGQVEDLDGDESDGYDSTLQALDWESAGHILDDDLHDLMVKTLPAGVRLTCCFDCCHSGTIMDVPYVYKCDGTIELSTSHVHMSAALKFLEAAKDLKDGSKLAATEKLKDGVRMFFSKPKRTEKERLEFAETHTSLADVIVLSGCLDRQVSADTTINDAPTGAMSYALIQVLGKNPQPIYTDLLFQLRETLKVKYRQVPQLSTGRPMDMGQKFIM